MWCHQGWVAGPGAGPRPVSCVLCAPPQPLGLNRPTRGEVSSAGVRGAGLKRLESLILASLLGAGPRQMLGLREDLGVAEGVLARYRLCALL